MRTEPVSQHKGMQQYVSVALEVVLRPCPLFDLNVFIYFARNEVRQYITLEWESAVDDAIWLETRPSEEWWMEIIQAVWQTRWRVVPISFTWNNSIFDESAFIDKVLLCWDNATLISLSVRLA